MRVFENSHRKEMFKLGYEFVEYLINKQGQEQLKMRQVFQFQVHMNACPTQVLSQDWVNRLRLEHKGIYPK